jgi:gamma-glutamyltranspeptidase/glutathione hydrolase
VVDGLRRRGHEVTLAGEWALGRLSAVGRDPERGVVWGAANPRGMQSYAVGR